MRFRNFGVALAVWLVLVCVAAGAVPKQIVERQGAIVQIANVGQNWGSGTHIGGGFVLTCRHLVERQNQFRIIERDGTSHEARLLGYDTTWDFGLLYVADATERLPAVPLGAKGPLAGNQVFACGYGPPPGKLLIFPGKIRGYGQAGYNTPRENRRTTHQTMLVQSSTARGGDSGGPILDQQGFLVGVIWGTGDDGTIVGTEAGQARKFLNTLAAAWPGRQNQFRQIQDCLGGRCNLFGRPLLGGELYGGQPQGPTPVEMPPPVPVAPPYVPPQAPLVPVQLPPSKIDVSVQVPGLEAAAAAWKAHLEAEAAAAKAKRDAAALAVAKAESKKTTAQISGAVPAVVGAGGKVLQGDWSGAAGELNTDSVWDIAVDWVPRGLGYLGMIIGIPYVVGYGGSRIALGVVRRWLKGAKHTVADDIADEVAERTVTKLNGNAAVVREAAGGTA